MSARHVQELAGAAKRDASNPAHVVGTVRRTNSLQPFTCNWHSVAHLFLLPAHVVGTARRTNFC